MLCLYYFSHPIFAVEYSCTGDNILVVAGNAQAKVIDRDGFEVIECPKGDQYIADMARTKVNSFKSDHTILTTYICLYQKP